MTAASVEQFLQTLPLSAADTARWDSEWLAYLNQPWVDIRRYLRPHTALKPKPGALEQIKSLPAAAVLDHDPFEDMYPLWTWAPGADLVGKTVLEVGCGPGYLGKMLGFIAGQYIGVDHSQFALALARLVSGPNCHYCHVSDAAAIARFRGKVDTMVGRFFFIHQNFDTAAWVLRLAHHLLKPTGVVHADFYRADPAVEQGIIFPAKSPLSPEHPSCGFEYTDADIAELAAATGFRVTDRTTHLGMQRRFTRLVKAA